ncbi:MAG: PQQ-dependent sugar dehydrogenase [Verrucomicrobia bacterium]|nr:PQQ-dependent sugar dehydrogenase [Verrucomicrobiota bacterium]
MKLSSPLRRRAHLGTLLAAIVFAVLPVSNAAPRPPWTSNRVVGSPNPPAPYNVERLFPQVTFDHPVDLAFLPGSTRLFVADQSGKIWTFDTKSMSAQTNLVVDLRAHHQPLDSILGFTFHPGFATNRYIFINYNEPGGREDGAFVSRFTVSTSNPPTIDPTSEKVIIRWLSGGHNGCTLAFGNDGFLYISTGDAADPDPPDGKRKTGQDVSDLLSSILRIDVDHADGVKAYSIPRDNPFVSIPGARPEIWSFGFRNPFRMSIDRATGDLWVGDVGWEQWEMIYFIKRGGNYGWSLTEGPNPHLRTDVKQGPGPILPPMTAHPHSEAASITGGYVYHGQRLAKLRGAYIYGDWETGKFWALRHDGDKLVSDDELCDTTLKPVAFTLDSSGELIILDYNGGFYQLVPNSAPPANEAFPRQLSATGIFTTLTPLTLATGVVPYRINAEMWNDHATAERVLGVPGDAALATEGGVGNITGGTWFFPSNTVLARTLTLEMETGKPSSRRRIETQLLHWDGQAWNPYTYRWNAAQSDAELVSSEGTNDTFTVTDASAPGGRRETPWRFGSRAECLRCHNAWAGEALTLNWQQLGARGANGASEFERLIELGVLKAKDRRDGMLRAIINPYDDSQELADRARSWLHVNCSACHRFGAGGAVAIHLNFDKPLKEMRTLDEKPTRGDFGLLGGRVISSGHPYRSALLYRISTEGSGRMPHIGSRLVDEAGVRAVRDWIRSLPQNPEADLAAARKLGAENSSLLAQLQGDGRRDAIGKLLGTANGSLALLNEAAAPALRIEAATAAASHTNALIRDLFQRFLPAEQRRKTLGSEIDPLTILALSGNAARGREVFLGASQCARCHVCGGEGRLFGPDLSGIARKYQRAQLLEQILLPSKIIAPEFKSTTVTLRDESEITGFVLKRGATEVVLRDETLAERGVKLTDVKDSRESTLSAMPEGLLAPLTAQEAADVLEFLFTSKPASGP